MFTDFFRVLFNRAIPEKLAKLRRLDCFDLDILLSESDKTLEHYSESKPFLWANLACDDWISRWIGHWLHMFSILENSCLYLVFENFDNILYYELLVLNAMGFAQIWLKNVHTGIASQFNSFKMVEGVMNWFCTRGSKTPKAFSAFLEHFSNCARNINLLLIVIPCAVDSVPNFIVVPCNTILFVNSRISSRLLEKMTTSVSGTETLRRHFPIHFVISSQSSGR